MVLEISVNVICHLVLSFIISDKCSEFHISSMFFPFISYRHIIQLLWFACS